MLGRLYRKVELLANLAIVVVAVLIAIVLIQKYFFPGPTGRQRPQLENGSKISLPNIDWVKNGQTLLVVLQKDCRFCTESASFYQKLVQQSATDNRTKLVAVLPQTIGDSQQYLDQIDVDISDIRQTSLNSIKISGTPTLVLVDGNGVVKKSWIGKLPPEREQEVLREIYAESPNKVLF